MRFEDGADPVEPHSELYHEALRLAWKRNPNLKRVLELLESAMASGDKAATYAIATWYLHGKSPVIKRNLVRAVELLREAGRVVPDAAYDLAVCYENGEGVEADPGRAFRWYMQAALLGNKQAVLAVARCFYFGIGVEECHGWAEPWFQAAERLGIYPKPRRPAKRKAKPVKRPAAKKTQRAR